MDFQLRQHRRDVHRQVWKDLPDLRVLSAEPRRTVHVPERPRGLRREAQRRRACVCGGIHGANEPRRHERGDHRIQLPQQLRAVRQLVGRRLSERQRRSPGLSCELGDGIRQLRLFVQRRPADVAGGPPGRPIHSGGGMASGRSGHDACRRRVRRRLADRQRFLRERRTRLGVGRDVPRRGRGQERGVCLQTGAAGRRVCARPEDLPDLERQAAVRRV